eukprot:ANDGO_08387.mRNA.1 hypothetical protein
MHTVHRMFKVLLVSLVFSILWRDVHGEDSEEFILPTKREKLTDVQIPLRSSLSVPIPFLLPPPLSMQLDEDFMSHFDMRALSASKCVSSGCFYWNVKTAELRGKVELTSAQFPCPVTEYNYRLNREVGTPLSVYLVLADADEIDSRLRTIYSDSFDYFTAGFPRDPNVMAPLFIHVGSMLPTKSVYSFNQTACELLVREETSIEFPFKYQREQWTISRALVNSRQRAGVVIVLVDPMNNIVRHTADNLFKLTVFPHVTFQAITFESLFHKLDSEHDEHDAGSLGAWWWVLTIASVLVTVFLTFALAVRFYFPVRKWYFSHFSFRNSAIVRCITPFLFSRSVRLHRNDPSSGNESPENEDAVSLPSFAIAEDWIDRFEERFGSLPPRDPVRLEVLQRLSAVENSFHEKIRVEAAECSAKWESQVSIVTEERTWAETVETLAHKRAERESALRQLQEEEARLRKQEEEEALLYSRMEQELRLRSGSAVHQSASSSVGTPLPSGSSAV